MQGVNMKMVKYEIVWGQLEDENFLASLFDCINLEIDRI